MPLFCFGTGTAPRIFCNAPVALSWGRRTAKAGLVAWLLTACGSRTGLLGGEFEADAGEEAGDAAADGAPPSDALPPLDVTPGRDAPSGCTDAGPTQIYVITERFTLMAFDPARATFTGVGSIDCPTQGVCSDGANGTLPASPYSMAVAKTGFAYVEYCDGEIFRVDLATAACQATAFVPGAQGFPTRFGMGYAENAQGTGELLYLAGDDEDAGLSRTLGWIAPPSFDLHVVGPFVPPIGGAELTGTGSGGLYAFYSLDAGSGIAQIDTHNAELVGAAQLASVTQGQGWAFAFWGGDFYTFTAPQGTTIVQRFRPTDGSILPVASTSEVVVGAGVSTCAPQR